MQQQPLQDVVITGYTDTEEYSRFHPMYERIYFIFDEKIFELYINDSGIIDCRTILKIEVWFDLDENDEFSLMSIYSLLFKTEQHVTILNIDYDVTPFSKMKINYKEGDIKRDILLDSNNFFGFTLF
ncbi:hypothetical protein AB7044_19345 [Providencia stuartii]|nr:MULTISPECIES: hypothetical protein [Providencia]MTC13785.1 hypothetical protein [Providencia stuartii]HEM7144098.1 hypothetical protein [Providencia stuartii]